MQRSQHIVQDFGREALALFDDVARRAGGIHAEDRHGVRRFFPCTTLAIGAVRITPGHFRHAEEVANLAAAAKREAKLAGTGVVLHTGAPESVLVALGAPAAPRALQDVLAAY